MILMSEKTGGEVGQTATEAKHCARPEKKTSNFKYNPLVPQYQKFQISFLDTIKAHGPFFTPKVFSTPNYF